MFENRIFARHSVTHSTIYQYISILPISQPFDEVAIYTRDLVIMHASPGVTWRDIFEELEKATDDSVYLKTVTRGFQLGIVSMNANSFRELAVRRPRDVGDTRVELEIIIDMCKEMVAQRDFEAAGGHSASNVKGSHLSDYWPKD